MSEAEVKKLLDGITNLKHRTIFILIYSAGLRLRELTNLRISDIDSQAMRIKVVQGKGKKDRYTLLSEQVLLRLRDYYVKYKPVEFLFNGWRKGSSISPRTVQRVLTLALKKAGLGDKNYSVHTLRHCFATHLLDNGTDLHAIKELLGHNDIKTTMVYMHLTKTRVQRIVNPYDRLMAQPQ